jgi:hypothetical protein
VKSIFLYSIVFLMLAGCAHDKEQRLAASAHIAGIRNSDIRWGGNFIGLYATVTGRSAAISTGAPEGNPMLHHDLPPDAIRLSPTEVTPLLLESLKDPNRCVAAHVLLTEIFGFKDPINAASWNGLRVNLLANGKVEIPDDQQSDLIKKWALWSADQRLR